MYRGLIVLIICHFSVDLFTGIWPLYKKIIGIDLKIAGTVALVGGLAGNIAQLYFGQVSDKGRRRVYMFLGVLLSSAAALYPYFTHYLSYGVLILITFIGSSMFHPAATGIAANLTTHKKGAMVSLFVCGGGLGLALGQMIFMQVYNRTNGQTVWLFIIPAIALILCQFALPKSISSKKSTFQSQNFLKDLAGVFKNLKLIYLMEVLNAALNIGFIFLIPELMIKMEMGESMINGGGHFFFIMGGVLLMSFSGHISDKLGFRNSMIYALLLAIPCYYVLLNIESLPFGLKLLLFIIVGGLLSICNPLGVAYGNRRMPNQGSLVSALLMGGAWSVGNVSYIMVGFLGDKNEPIYILNQLGVILLCILIAALFLPKIQKEK